MVIYFVYDHEILPVNYTICHKDKLSRGGGILMVVARMFDSGHLFLPADLEIVTITLGCY